MPLVQKHGQIIEVSADQFPQPTFAENKRRKVSDLAAKRWAVETGGIVFNSIPVATDRDSQQLIDAAARLAARDPDAPVKFKSPSGWLTLDAATLDAIALAVGRHVRACFVHEADLAALIDAATTQRKLDAVSIETGWP